MMDAKTEKDFDLQYRRRTVEIEENWGTWRAAMPYLQFPAEWKIQMIPPIGGAMLRFRVRLPSGTVKSIYFDSLCRLGWSLSPYWEVYPYKGDCGRCELTETEELLRMIADETSE